MLVSENITITNISVARLLNYDSGQIDDYRGLFSKFKAEDVIFAEKYEDNVWFIFNEKIKPRIDFNLDELRYQKASTDRSIPPLSDFINALKGFTLYMLRQFALNSVRESIPYLKKMILETDFFHPDMYTAILSKKLPRDSGYYRNIYVLLDFFNFFHLDDSDELITLLYHQVEEYSIWREETNQGFNSRELASFESMFKFGFVLDEFWENCTPQEKEEFFPLKLWWDITTIIPIRVTEFVLTPYDCLSESDGHHYLAVRRTILKGPKGQAIPRHKIEADYKLQKIRVTDKIHDLIVEYRDLVEHYDFEKNFFGQDSNVGRRRFLLSQRSYVVHRGTRVGHFTRVLDFFSAGNLQWLLKRYYQKVLINQLNYEVIAKGAKVLADFQMEAIQLMDTRHFAFINMALSDVDPLTMKEISGHRKIHSSMHYYNHVESFVKCYTYNMAKKIMKDKRSELAGPGRTSNESSNEALRIREGTRNCISKQENFEDCVKVDNDCAICRFNVPIGLQSQQGITERIKQNQEKLRSEVDALKELIKHFGKGTNGKQDYRLIVNRIKTIAEQNAVMMSKSQVGVIKVE